MHYHISFSDFFTFFHIQGRENAPLPSTNDVPAGHAQIMGQHVLPRLVNCRRLWSKCPVCRAVIQTVMRLYFVA